MGLLREGRIMGIPPWGCGRSPHPSAAEFASLVPVLGKSARSEGLSEHDWKLAEEIP